MTEQTSARNNAARQDEYIDVIDVLAFLWRAKVFVIVGVIVTSTAALLVANVKMPPAYKSSVPVTSVMASTISAEQVVVRLQALLDRQDVIQGLQSAGILNVGGKPPFKIVNASGQINIEFSSLSGDPTGNLALNAVRVLASLTEKINKAEAEKSTASPTADGSVSQLQTEFAQLIASKVTEEAPYKAQLFALETALSQKSGRSPIPSLPNSDASAGDDVPRLLGAADSKMTTTEKTRVIREYAQLMGNIKAIEAKYSGSLSKLSQALSSSAAVNADTAKGYPVLVADEETYRTAVTTGTHERYESKRTLFLILGVLLGGVLGLMAYGIKLFFDENRTRMKTIFRD